MSVASLCRSSSCSRCAMVGFRGIGNSRNAITMDNAFPPRLTWDMQECDGDGDGDYMQDRASRRIPRLLGFSGFPIKRARESGCALSVRARAIPATPLDRFSIRAVIASGYFSFRSARDSRMRACSLVILHRQKRSQM